MQSTQRPLVLLVEDQELLLELWHEQMEEKGILKRIRLEVRRTMFGAVDAANTGAFHIIIIDAHVPLLHTQAKDAAVSNHLHCIHPPRPAIFILSMQPWEMKAVRPQIPTSHTVLTPPSKQIIPALEEALSCLS